MLKFIRSNKASTYIIFYIMCQHNNMATGLHNSAKQVNKLENQWDVSNFKIQKTKFYNLTLENCNCFWQLLIRVLHNKTLPTEYQ